MSQTVDDFDINEIVDKLDISNIIVCKKRYVWGWCGYIYNVKLKFRNGKKKYIAVPGCNEYHNYMFDGRGNHNMNTCTTCMKVKNNWNALYSFIKYKMKESPTIMPDNNELYSDTSSEGEL
jgi:hypothetical protein